MKMKIIKLPSFIKIYYLIFSLTLSLSNAFAQPYIYYPKLIVNSLNQSDIYRLNLANGEDNLFIKDAGRFDDVYWNSDQTNLFINQRNVYKDVIKLDSLNKKVEFADNYGEILGIHDAPKINRVIFDYSDGDGFYKNSVIYNRDSYEPVDTVVVDTSYPYFNIYAFLSKDEKILYANLGDTTGIYFSAFDILNNTFLYKNRKVTNLEPSHMYYLENDGRQGKALFLHEDAPGYKGLKFFVVNPDSGLYFNPVPIPPVRSKGYLSANADYVIIEQVNVGQPPYYEDFHTGKIQIYNAITGDKITGLTLPPSKSARILIFDNYPNMFYYYNYENNTVIPVDLTKLHIENNLSGSVKVAITKTDSVSKFSYTITNSDTSSQAIKNIYIENESAVLSTTLPDGWINITGADKFNLIGFKSQSSGILAGATQSEYAVSTTGLPTIGNIYLQSGRSRVDSADIFGNSYVVETLVPTSKPEVFNPIEFVDTLIYYNNKSLSNKWLSAEWVKNVLASSLDNAKLFITQKLYSSAAPVMQQLITILDSYKTSGFVKDEAYYLLKINSQYLLEELNVLAVTPPAEAVAQLDSIFAANELNKTNSWYSAAWVYTTLKSILDNARITLNQNNLAGTKSVIQQFIITLDSYKTSGFITIEGLNNIRPKCLVLIEMLQ